MHKPLFFLLVLLSPEPAQANMGLWTEFQLLSTIGWRDTGLSNSQRKENLSGQSYKVAIASSVVSNFLYMGVSYDHAKLYNQEANFSSLNSETAFLVKTGLNLLPDWRLDLNYRHILYGTMTLETVDLENSKDRIQGGRYGLSIEWTGMLGLGLVAGAELAAPYLKLTSSSQDSWSIQKDQEFYLGGIVRF